MDSPQRGYADRGVLVVGARVAGAAAARVLARLGARVTVVDRTRTAQLEELADQGITTLVADDTSPVSLEGVDQVVVSPGVPPGHPLVQAAARAGIEVFSEPELAWRLRGPDAAPWLAVTGSNGKTTTVTMLADMLRAAGLRAAALGNIGEPLVDVVMEPRYDVIAVELSSFQLHWSIRLAPSAGALLNLADDHLDWHGGFEAYAAAKALIWRGEGGVDARAAAGRSSDASGSPHDPLIRLGTPVAVGNADDPRVAALLAQAPGRRVGFTVGPPGPDQLGVVDGVLVDRAFEGGELIAADKVRPSGVHNVANALAAAALARAAGVPPDAVRRGLEGYVPQPHRNAVVATVNGVTFVDDSKATNPHAAAGSLTAYPRVVWIAGGQLKGVEVDDLVASIRDRLVGAVLLGVDRKRIAAALARHTPDIPVVDVTSTDDGAMRQAVAAAWRLARPGDTVLLAPAAASLDMYPSYAHRGRAFAEAVAEVTGSTGAVAQ